MDYPALLDAYVAGPNQLRSSVAGLSGEQLISRPVAGRWSVLEVVCHLSDTDANIVHRLKRVLSEERPAFDRVRPDLMLSALAYHDRDVEEELGLFDLGRRQIARILRSRPSEAWGRRGACIAAWSKCSRARVVGERTRSPFLSYRTVTVLGRLTYRPPSRLENG